jgi:hypothetical protein
VKYQGTAITAPPDAAGVFGRAWRLTMLPVGQRPTPDQDGTVSGWIVHRPGAHLLWDHFLLSAIHLRPIANVRDPKLTRADQTHEICFIALNPEHPLPSSLVVDGAFQFRFLRPIDLVHQFAVGNDAQAAELLDLCVHAIVDGGGNPDQDHRSAWRRFIDANAQLFRDGVHKVVAQ